VGRRTVDGMGYAERVVAPGIEVWHSTGPAGPQRILPDGCLDLILTGDELLVAGPDTRARVHHSAEPQPATGVRLHAGRGPVLLGVPAHELRDRTLPLEDVWGSGRARRLTEQVAERPGPTLERWATAGKAGETFDGFGARVRALLDGGRSVAEVSDELGWSTRQLHRRLLPVFGYGPQHLGRVLRLVRAVGLADAGAPWAEVAQRAGYADQAHLARDVRALTGVTPTELRRERVRSVQDAA
jgi:AraC-like DNA-binding protein